QTLRMFRTVLIPPIVRSRRSCRREPGQPEGETLMRGFETWKVWTWRVCALLVWLAVPSVAMAQQASAILGQVRDESGGVLPGVTVAVSSSSLQVKEVADVTNAQ